MLRSRLVSAGIALSLANLVYMPGWHMLFANPPHPYFLQELPAVIYYQVVPWHVLVLASAMWGVWELIAWLQSRVLKQMAQVVFLLFALIPVDYIRVQVPWLRGSVLESAIGIRAYGLVMGLFLMLLLWTVIRWRDRLMAGVVTAVLVLLPFSLINLAHVARCLIDYRLAIADSKKPADMLPANGPRRRVLWLVFDELDQQVAFDERPADVALPEFDRFRRSSVAAANAFPPAGETPLSMPALICGRLVKLSQPVSVDDLRITFGDADTGVLWSRQPNLFRQLRQLGANSGLIGWYHPYHRVLGQDLVAGLDVPMAQGSLNRIVGFREASRLVCEAMAGRVMLLPRFMSRRDTVRQEHVEEYLRIRNAALKAVVDPRLDVTLIHWPVPHSPNIYSRARHHLVDWGSNDGLTYLDNLVLADRSLGQIRRVLEGAGQWQDTTVIISADHWWRWKPQPTSGRPDHRIPFMVKIAGQQAPITFRQPFNTVLTGDLIKAIWQGQIRTGTEVATWLDQHRSIGETPYLKNAWPERAADH